MSDSLVATAGFFCNGKIGPIGESRVRRDAAVVCGNPFVHGLFTEPEPER